jgi:chitinase
MQLVAAPIQSNPQWSLGFWTPWGKPSLPISEIHWSALTHIAYAWAIVRADGTLDLDMQRVSIDAAALVTQAHAHHVKALLAVAQAYWTGDKASLNIATNKNLNFLVQNLVKAVNTYGFDGIDIDWEPFHPSSGPSNGPGEDGASMKKLLSALRSQLGTRSLSADAVVTDSAFWGTAVKDLDRLTVMTYDLTGTWNPHSWHNAALFSADGKVFSVDSAVWRFADKGVPPNKINIGIPFFGYVWSESSVDGPLQHWDRQPKLTQSYYQGLVAQRYIPEDRRYFQRDPKARVPFLSIPATVDHEAQFVTYDDPQSVTEKVAFARLHGLGGWSLWELAGDYLPSQSPDQPLLDAVGVARVAPLPDLPWIRISMKTTLRTTGQTTKQPATHIPAPARVYPDVK